MGLYCFPYELQVFSISAFLCLIGTLLTAPPTILHKWRSRESWGIEVFKHGMLLHMPCSLFFECRLLSRLLIYSLSSTHLALSPSALPSSKPPSLPHRNIIKESCHHEQRSIIALNTLSGDSCLIVFLSHRLEVPWGQGILLHFVSGTRMLIRLSTNVHWVNVWYRNIIHY